MNKRLLLGLILTGKSNGIKNVFFEKAFHVLAFDCFPIAKEMENNPFSAVDRLTLVL